MSLIDKIKNKLFKQTKQKSGVDIDRIVQILKDQGYASVYNSEGPESTAIYFRHRQNKVWVQFFLRGESMSVELIYEQKSIRYNFASQDVEHEYLLKMINEFVETHSKSELYKSYSDFYDNEY